MTTYEKWKKNNTVLLSTIRNPDILKTSKMGEYLLVVDPVVDPATEKKGKKTFPPDTLDGERSWEVENLSQAEINEYNNIQEAMLLRKANEALLEVLQNSQGLAYWANKTDQEIKDQVANTPNSFAGFRTNDEKLALGLADVVKILKVWRDLGRIV